MSNTEALRAAEAALTMALDDILNCTGSRRSIPAVNTAINTVRAALAQPAASGEPAEQGAAALALLKRIRYHAQRHALPRDWLTAADEVLGTWGPVKLTHPEIAAATAQPAPALVPLTNEQAHAMWVNATIERTDMGSVYVRGLRDGEAAHGIGTPAKEAPHPLNLLQAGFNNAELLAHWRKKLPGVEPTDRELSAFAVGTEVGWQRARDVERQDWARVHHVLAKHGKHPGRTDDHLADVIDRALAAAPDATTTQSHPQR